MAKKASEAGRDDKYRLTKKASEVYEGLSTKRDNVADVVEKLAEITIPAIFPPENYQEGDKLYVPNQSHNAACVNNLSNVLMYTGFPPGQPMFAYSVLEHKLKAQEAEDPELWSHLTLALARLEVLHRTRMEATVLRNTYVEYLKLQIVTGNALWRHESLDNPTVYSMRHYVVKRNNLGEPRYVVLKERIEADSLAPEHKAFIESLKETKGRAKAVAKKDDPDNDLVDIFTAVRWKPEGGWCRWQEVDSGEMLPDTEAEGGDTVPPPLYPGWMIPVYGNDWGRSYCEEYRGDLYIVENDHHAMNDAAAIAAWSLVMVNPAGVTDINAVKEADNLSVISGKPDDIGMLRAEKGQDFQVVTAHSDTAERRLARAFILNSAIQRQGERVTREEIVRMAQDIDRALGGIHTQVAQTHQKHVIERFIFLHEMDDSGVPTVAHPDLVKVAVVTGVDALGRSVEEQNLVEFGGALGQVFGPQGVASLLSPTDFARRLAAAKGIKPDGLVKTPEQLQQERQAAQQQAMGQEVVKGAAGPVAKQLAGQMAAQQTE